jgi:MFS family permease
MTFLSRRPAALAYPDVRRYLVARFIVSIGLEMLTLAVGWQVYQQTRNPLYLGLIGLAQFMPFILLILPAGQVADRYDRRRIQFICYVTEAAAAAALLALSLAGVATTLPIFAAMAVFGVSRAFNTPTSQALLPNLVPPEQLSNVVALNTSLFQVATIAGPAAGGLLILLGIEVVFAVAVVMFLVGAAIVVGLQSGGGATRLGEPFNVKSLLSGITFVRRNRPVLASISLDLFAVLFGGATALLPAFASDVLHVGPTGLGLLRAAPAVGAAAVGGWMAWRPIREGVGRSLFGTVALFGLATVVFGLSTSFAVSLVALTVLGAADMVSVFIRHLLVQLATPDAIRGRVSAVNAVFIGASNELGEFESGITAALWGIVPAAVVGGTATLAVAVLWALLFPELRRLDRFPEGEPAPAHAAEAQAATAGPGASPG